jgi:hypothetical protein
VLGDGRSQAVHMYMQGGGSQFLNGCFRWGQRVCSAISQLVSSRRDMDPAYQSCSGVVWTPAPFYSPMTMDGNSTLLSGVVLFCLSCQCQPDQACQENEKQFFPRQWQIPRTGAVEALAPITWLSLRLPATSRSYPGTGELSLASRVMPPARLDLAALFSILSGASIPGASHVLIRPLSDSIQC